ncbi:hypothetical protein Q1695_000662 [Nippostrongylus brasiliensis]|nr:hypothetical protein Q1695_000662 [Nippostrongylus brasiliensis]
MWLLLIFCIHLLLLILYARRRLHIPLPTEMADRSTIESMEIVTKLICEYPANIIELVFGDRARCIYVRLIIGLLMKLQRTNNSHVTIRTESLGGVNVRIHTPKEKRSCAALVYIHGGGWIMMRAEHSDPLCNTLARSLGVTVFSVDYRLAPEHPFPCGLVDCETVIRILYKEGAKRFNIDPEKISISGESAGGNLAAAVAQKFQRQNEPYVKSQVLIYPVIHVFGFRLPSYLEYYKKFNGAAVLNPTWMARFMLLYLGLPASKKNLEILKASQHISRELKTSKEFQKAIGYWFTADEVESAVENDETRPLQKIFATKGTDPDLCPVFGVRKDLPPAMVLSAEYDVLRFHKVGFLR